MFAGRIFHECKNLAVQIAILVSQMYQSLLHIRQIDHASNQIFVSECSRMQAHL